ncbi:MAG: 16S rRNA (uracil(1498)-N(3))-methyltransferase [Gammaproteobacteria bacterium]|nr:16S rRNA (uracil(1498)-N(3))-methyltransferase [Gammaproteobacteria bacterium]
MRDIRVFLEAPLASALASARRLALPAPAAQHLLKVLRLRSGAAITIFDGKGGEYRARLELAGRGEAWVELAEHLAIERESPLHITLLQGLARGERMDWVMQKATELGVQRIAPVSTARSVVQLDAYRGDSRSAHWRAVAAAACEQCGRNTLPIIDPLLRLAAALQAVAHPTLRLVLNAESAVTLGAAVGSPMAVALPGTGEGAANRPIALLVGPEGGLDDDELALAKHSGFQGVRLGPRILRTETAGIAALAALQCLAGDLA